AHPRDSARKSSLNRIKWMHRKLSRNSLKQPLYLDASTSAFAHGIGHSSTGRVNHGHESHKAEVVGGKVDIVAVKGEPFGILLFRQVIVAETWKEKKRRTKEKFPDSEKN
uniref:Uncharacterized protein n=1 Tax=Pseudonaja textilis TaxID=8673 RepID=A0A670ZYB8_PSETE